MNKPVLFCYDGSDGSKTALRAVVDVIKPADAVILVVWMPAAVQLSRAGSFIVSVPNEGEIDEEEAAIAKQIAEEGAVSARARGYSAIARTAEATESVAKTIEDVAEEIDASLIVCGQRGRGMVGSALLGSVSHALAAHTKRPVLIAPQHPAPSAASKWWQPPIACRARAAFTVGTRCLTRPGRITRARTKSRMKIPTAHANAVVSPWTVDALSSSAGGTVCMCATV